MSLFSQIVSEQHQYFGSNATKPVSFRRTQLKKLRACIVGNQSAIETALKKDLGKNDFDAYASEIGIVLNEITVALKNLRRLTRPKAVKTPLFLWPGRSQIIYEPLGVCLIISPWNYPFQLAMAPLVAALAAGNCVVLKPSERSVHTSKLMAELLSQTFASPHVHTILADKTESARLLQEPFQKIFFTGSKTVGQHIYQAAAKQMVPVTLELGGKNPCIVTPCANLSVTAQRIAWGKFFNAGQTCVAPDYLLVHEDIKHTLLKELQKATLQLFGETAEKSPNYGRIIDRAHVAQLKKHLRHGTIYMGGTVIEENCFVSPTILDNIDWSSPIMDDEIFGPILPVIGYSNLETTLQQIKQRPASLAFYLFCSDATVRKQVIEQIPFGGGCINDTLVHFSSPHLPVGGVGASGIGRYRGTAGLLTFSNTKTIVQTPFWPNLQLRYPPFPNWKHRLLKRLMK